MSQEPQECHIYQLFPPTLPCPSSPIRSPLSPSLSPSLSPIPLFSPSIGLMRVASVQTLLESSFMHSGLKFTEVKATLTHSDCKSVHLVLVHTAIPEVMKQTFWALCISSKHSIINLKADVILNPFRTCSHHKTTLWFFCFVLFLFLLFFNMKLFEACFSKSFKPQYG